MHECNICTDKFTRKDNLNRHKAEVHHVSDFNHNYALSSDSNKRLVYPYKCHLCDKRFKRKENVKQHLDLAACVKSSTCNICHKSFTRKVDLKRHNETVHKKEKGIECKICKQMFTRKDNMLKHEKLQNKQLKTPFVHF